MISDTIISRCAVMDDGLSIIKTTVPFSFVMTACGSLNSWIPIKQFVLMLNKPVNIMVI